MFDLISWKYSSEMVCRELELAKKKKQALDDLLAAGRISQSTYGLLEKELNGSIHDLETYQQSLFDKMTARADALEKQVESLELFLANLEIHHAAGDIDEQTYESQNKAILLALEATKQELDDIRSSLSGIVPEAIEAPTEQATTETTKEAEETTTSAT